MNPASTLNEILEAVRTLSPEEQAHLRNLLDDAREGVTEDVFAEHMVDSGLLECRRTASRLAVNDFQPVPVQGKPTSAVIIEERR